MTPSFALLLLALGVILIPRLRPPAEFLPAAGDWLSWQDNLQTLFGLATLFVAALVWYNDLAEDWAADLPRLLTFAFFHAGQPALVCYHAYLAGEADIRAWSQQIAGRQMAGTDLKMRPVVDAGPPELLTDGATVFLHHRVRLTLTDLPAVLAAAGQEHSQAMCLLWRPRQEEKPPLPSAAIPAAQAAQIPDLAVWCFR